MEQPGGERSPKDAAVLALAVERQRRQSAKHTEPDAEHLALGAPRLAAEVGHCRERHERVGDQHQPKRPATVESRNELEPDEHAEADHGRPASEPDRVVGRVAARESQPPPERAQQAVERREWIDPRPRRPDQGAHQSQPDPTVGPQEERRDVAVARAADESLRDDPQPPEQSDRAEQHPQPAWHGARRHECPCWRRRRRVAQHDESERHRHCQGGTGDVGDQRQGRLITLGHLVGQHDRGQCQQQPGRHEGDAEPESNGQAPSRTVHGATLAAAALTRRDGGSQRARRHRRARHRPSARARHRRRPIHGPCR